MSWTGAEESLTASGLHVVPLQCVSVGLAGLAAPRLGKKVLQTTKEGQRKG